VREFLEKAGRDAATVSRKVRSGLETGLGVAAGAAVAGAQAVGAGAKLVAGAAYGAAGRAAVAAAAAAAAAAAKVRSFSIGRRTKNYFMGKKKLTNIEVGIVKARGMNPNSTEARALIKERRRMSGKDKLTREGGLLRAAAEKMRAAVSATRRAVGVAGAAISKGASNSFAFLGRKAGNARNYLSSKAGNARKYLSRKAGNAQEGLSNLYTRMRYGSHEARAKNAMIKTSLEHEAAVKAYAKVSQNKNNANSKAAALALSKVSSSLKKANVAAANGSNAKAATALGAAVTVAKTAAKKGLFSRISNAAKNFTRGVGVRLGKLRNIFKGTKKNSAHKRGASAKKLFAAPREPASSPKNIYGMSPKGAEGRSARKLMNVLAGRSEGAKPLMFGLPAPISRSAAARRLGIAPAVNLSGAAAALSAAQAVSRAKTPAQRDAAAAALSLAAGMGGKS
jgi:hypothetical protein